MMGENCAEEKKKRELLKKWIQESRNVVFFGGAGVSTESGIPDSEAWTAFTIRSMIIRRRQF
mgnify:CR=1 FL=1